MIDCGDAGIVLPSITQLANRVAELERRAQPFILGYTAAYTLNTPTGLSSGLKAADLRCRTAFPGSPSAHLCHAYEIQRALASDGVATGVASDTPAWIAHDTFRNTSPRGNQSAWSNCRNLLNPGAFVDGEVPTATVVTLVLNRQDSLNEQPGSRYNIEQQVSCGNARPALCCR